MNRILVASLAAALALSLPFHDAEAKRLSSGGMKRSVPAQTAPQTPPAQTPQQPVAPQQAAAPKTTPTPQAPAAAPKRSWLGPLAGLAAGIGLAALASHLGFGAELGQFMTLMLLAIVGFIVLRFVMRRFAAPRQATQFAGATAGAGAGASPTPAWNPQPAAPAVASPVSAVPSAAAVPTGFDAQGFEKIAKQVFIRMQAANDAGDQADLRRFTTPQMYANIQQELLERGQQTQRTDVLQLDARVVDVATEDGQEVVSVRFWGLIREASEQAAQDFDEIWHLVRTPGSEAWQIAGIQQTA